MSARTITFLSATDVKKCFPMREALETAHEAFVMLSSGNIRMPHRIQVDLEAHDGNALIMPSYSPQLGWLGLKLVTVSRRNESRSLPRIHAMMMVFDADTGEPLAIMDAEVLTAMRTGASSGLATDLLARKDAETAVIFGAGVQGHTQLKAISHVRALSQAYVIDTNQERAEKLAVEMGALISIPVECAESMACVREADIICTATNSFSPVFDNKDLKPGVHINGVGSFKPNMQEIPHQTVARALVVVDSRRSALKEAGDLIIPLKQGLIDENHIRAELGEIAAGQAKGRKSEEQITLFKSVGHAIQDLVAARRILENAARRKLGLELTP